MGEYKLVPIGIYRKQLALAARLLPITLFGALLCLQAESSGGPKSEVHVTLLGQPCLLQGPFDEQTLKSVHSIGPAQVYPTFISQNIPSSLEEARKSLEKIKSTSFLHALLDRYREKLRKRLEAQIALLAAILESKKTNQPSILQKTAAQYLQARDLRTFESLSKKHDLDAMFDIFNEAVEPDPEAEFHRAIKKLGIQYTCSFEENDENSPE